MYFKEEAPGAGLPCFPLRSCLHVHQTGAVTIALFSGSGRVNTFECELRDKIFSELRFETEDIDAITRDTLFFNDGLELDSVDALQILILIEREYDVTIPRKKRTTVLVTFGSLADYVREKSEITP